MIRKESEEQKQKTLQTVKDNFELLESLRGSRFSGRIDRNIRIDLQDSVRYVDPKRSYCLSCGPSMRSLAIALLSYYEEHKPKNVAKKRGRKPKKIK